MKNQFVSVIIPNYNHSSYLEQRIDSVLNQTYQDFEVIILDDCSTDSSKDVIEKYRGNQKIASIIYNEKNSGSTFKQWNRGIELAKGQYIWIAESDDYTDFFFLEKIINLFNDKVGLVYCNSLIVNEKSEPASFLNSQNYPNKKHHESFSSSFVIDGKEFIEKFMLRHNLIPNASGVVFTKDLYISAGMADEKMKLFGDWLMWIKILNKAHISYLDEPLNYFRNHSNNVRTKQSYTFNIINEYFEIAKFISFNLPKLKPLIFDRLLYMHKSYMRANKIRIDEKRQVLRYISFFTKYPRYYYIKNRLSK